MSDLHNAKALVNTYRTRNVALVSTPAGPVFMGLRNLKPAERKILLAIPKTILQAVLRWQS